MAKGKNITIKIESRQDSDGMTYTRVSYYKGHLADIWFLEEPEGYRYCIDYGFGTWGIDTYENELDAVRHIVKFYGFNGSHEKVSVKMGYYCNSEMGAMCSTDVENLNLVG